MLGDFATSACRRPRCSRRKRSASITADGSGGFCLSLWRMDCSMRNIACELKSQGLVCFQTVCCQFRQIDRVQQARRNPARKGFASAGDRSPGSLHPQGNPLAVVCALRRRSVSSGKRSASRWRARCFSRGTRPAKTRRCGSTPCVAAAARRWAVAPALSSRSHNTLPGFLVRSRIQMSNTGAVVFQPLLKQQNTKPCSGNPHLVRVGVSLRNRPFGIVCLIAMRQVNDLFHEERLC